MSSSDAITRKFDPIYGRRIGHLKLQVAQADIPDHERDTFRRIIGYADNETLTKSHLLRCGDVARSWEWDAYHTSDTKDAERALTMALLYDEFAKVLEPYARDEGTWTTPR